MNRLTMAKEVGRRGPILAARDKAESKQAEHPHADSAADHPTKRIPSLSPSDYVIGKGADGLQLGFYINANKLDRATQVANYHIYFVFEAMSTIPMVPPVRRPDLREGGFTMRPLSFHVTTAQLLQT